MAIFLVNDDEYVCRVGLTADCVISRDGSYPEQHDPDTGLLRLHEISIEDLNSKGFSLQRCSLYSHEAANANALERAERYSKKRGRETKFSVVGAHVVKTGAIHAILNEAGAQVFQIHQTPMDGQPAHAEIRAVNEIKRSMLLKWRTTLRDALGPIQKDFLSLAQQRH